MGKEGGGCGTGLVSEDCLLKLMIHQFKPSNAVSSLTAQGAFLYFTLK